MSSVPSAATTSPLRPPTPKGPGDRIWWGSAGGAGGAMAMAQLACNNRGATLAIAASTARAEALARDLALFCDGRPEAPAVVRFADWETLPYDQFSPHQDIISERMRTLYHLSQGQRVLVVVAAPSLLQRIAPPTYLTANSLVLSKGDRLDLAVFREQLSNAGYQLVDTVFQHGEYAVRGALIDIFPMGSAAPLRVELFDDEVESLRSFDPESQRTIRQIDQIELLPARECPLDRAAIARFKTQFVSRFDTDPRACPVYQDVSSGLSPAGVEYYLPLFFERTASFFEYLPEAVTVLIEEGVEVALEQFWRDASGRYESRRGDLRRPILPPGELFLPVSDVFAELKTRPRVQISEAPAGAGGGRFDLALTPPPELFVDARAPEPLAALRRFIEQQPERRVLFCAETAGRREALIDLLHGIRLRPAESATIAEFLTGSERFGIVIAALDSGVVAADPPLALLAEPQLFGLKVRVNRRQRRTAGEQDDVVKNLTELKVGAPVVHIEHGVGRYQGLTTLAVDGAAQEFLVLEYLDQAKLYVPVSNLHFISRYSGSDPDHAPLHRLGSDQWARAKRKAAEQIRDTAAELLEIYAKREAREGFACDKAPEAYAQFAASFPFEETPDQVTAIGAVRGDMLRKQPMDRLVCGDVGFGKTEVAMRAAFMAVESGKQVVVLVPTTLLAQQHYDNFRDRFADWPFTVEVMSRFRSSKEQERVKTDMEAGKVDILIGTHKLLQGNIRYPNLGLLVIDEEHRFGVRQKETLKALRAEVDILTLTATPIPRTLNMAMHGIRDLSIIATPPARRLSVKTFVRQTDTALIKEAVLREIMRGGQVYYLHNEVKTIDKCARELAEMVPEARVEVGHGQMRERELERVMSDFYHKRFNVLVCSTIIETGIDVPSANTIIIERADKFGLAQLHQLRGRVGRSHHQAYAYLLTPPPNTLTADAQKRLTAIEEAQDLGAGFMLASHDLEIRGAGELLGEEQSGQIQAIGFSLYMEMLERAVAAIKSGKHMNLDHPVEDQVEVDLHIPALLPDDYLPDVHTRLILYKRLANVKTDEALDELQVEMIDRFGLLPEPAKNLVQVTRLKLQAEALGVKKVEANRDLVRMHFAEETRLDPLTLVNLVQREPQRFKLEGAAKLRCQVATEDAASRLRAVRQLLDRLAQKSVA